MRTKPRRSLHDYIVREIGRRVVNGEWPVGTAIPSPEVLCDLLQVSRTALREALVALAAKGLLQSRQKIGTVVRPRDEWHMLDYDVLLWRVESDEGSKVIAELYRLRQLIEPLAASLAATHATRRDIEPIRKACEDMAEAGDNGLKVLDPDVRFHRAIIAASGNSLFSSIGLVIASALAVNFEVIKDSPRGHLWALPLHEAILKAIVAKDANGARLAMQKLLEVSENDLLEARAKQPGKKRRTHLKVARGKS